MMQALKHLTKAARQLVDADNTDTPEMWDELRDTVEEAEAALANADDRPIYRLTRADVRECARALWGDNAAAKLTEEHFDRAQRFIESWAGDGGYSWDAAIKDGLREVGQPQEV